MEGDCNVYAHSSLWMRPTGEWSINAKMVYNQQFLRSSVNWGALFLEIVGSSPDGAEPQFIFIFLGWPVVSLLLHT